MTFNLNEMYSYINRAGGIAKSNLFSVIIAPPQWNQNQNGPRLIQFLTDTAQLPGLTFATNDVKNTGYGPSWKLPHTPIYSDIDMTIMVDNNGNVLKFFHQWMQNIININPEGDADKGYNGAKSYSVQYPSHYTTSVTITLYSPDNEEIIIYTLNEAYPLRIGSPGLDWSSTNSILRLPVTFTFKTWTATTFKTNNQTLMDDLSSFNPFATTTSDFSYFNPETNGYYSLADILSQNNLSLINNDNVSLNIYF